MRYYSMAPPDKDLIGTVKGVNVYLWQECDGYDDLDGPIEGGGATDGMCDDCLKHPPSNARVEGWVTAIDSSVVDLCPKCRDARKYPKPEIQATKRREHTRKLSSGKTVKVSKSQPRIVKAKR